ncbi:hypothetical protein LLG07_00135 [bacterium]|nr:hypothetical protein [bacterium]
MRKVISIPLILLITIFIFSGCIHKTGEVINSGIYAIVTIGPIKPGKYILEPLKSNESFPGSSPIEVEVKPNKFTEVNISFDAGIR